MKINKRTLSVQILLVFFVMLLFGAVTFGESNIKKDINGEDFKSKAVFLSKAKIVKEIDNLKAEVNVYEKKNGLAAGKGAKVYSGQETAHLFGLYQEINLREHYLEYGDFKADVSQWEGFRLEKTGEPYDEKLVVQVMGKLEESNVPESFFKGFKIFLLPYSVPDVSGLGGAGYTMISATVNSDDLAYDLAVTLYHEIGHHIHLSFMPRETVAGMKLWNQYLQIKGATWHGPGNVNTTAWSDSSEETFAEDFRMLFDKTQPFFDDVSLGDPRNNNGKAEKLRTFISRLADEKTVVKYHSPWVPAQNPYDNISLEQEIMMLSLWLILGIGVGMVNLLQPNKIPSIRRMIRNMAPRVSIR